MGVRSRYMQIGFSSLDVVFLRTMVVIDLVFPDGLFHEALVWWEESGSYEVDHSSYGELRVEAVVRNDE